MLVEMADVLQAVANQCAAFHITREELGARKSAARHATGNAGESTR